MKTSNRKPSDLAFTRRELALIIAVLAILGVFLAKGIQRGTAQSRQVACIGNLKYLSLCFRAFANENRGEFPFSATNSPAFQDTNYVWKHFLTLSNEIGSAEFLQCPADRQRPYCDSFGNGPSGLVLLQNRAVSYFLNANANETNSTMLLLGDRNITGNPLNNTSLTLSSTASLQWDKNVHGYQGNAAFVDGSVQSKLKSVTVGTNQNSTFRLLVPN